jgi:hypothetical protein
MNEDRFYRVWRRTVSAAIVIGGLFLALFWPRNADAQTLVPAPAITADLRKGEGCAPGFFGEQWPGAKVDYGTRTDNGWFAYVWCKHATDAKPRYLAFVCVHGECLPQTNYWATVGDLIVGAVSRPRLTVINEHMAANPLVYACPIYPAGAQPPAQPASGLQFPPAGTPRAGICGDLLLAMRNTWPLIPPPPASAPTPQTGWKAYGGTIYRHAGGKLTGFISGKTAAKDAPCVGVTVATAGTFVYQQLVGGPLDEATRCIK